MYRYVCHNICFRGKRSTFKSAATLHNISWNITGFDALRRGDMLYKSLRGSNAQRQRKIQQTEIVTTF